MLQLNVEAYDLGEPPLASQATVTVNIIRNRHAPEFSPPTFEKTVDLNIAEGQEIIVMRAEDKDSQVRDACKCVLRG